MDGLNLMSEIEGLDLNINSEASIYPNAEVRVEKAQFSILHLETLCIKRKELVLNPDFQRNEVWKTKQDSELIESILMGIPIPLIYLFEDKHGKKQVVDGRQRITAILNFLSNNLKLSGLKILNKLNGYYFKDLEIKLQGIFEDYQLFFYIIQPPTPERVKFDIFDRVNRGGTPLNKQEMRNALYQGRCTSLLKNLATSIEFEKATGNAINNERMKDHYIILRSLAFLFLYRYDLKEYNNLLDYKSDIDDFLARFMMYINENDSDELISKLESLFKKAMIMSYNLFAEDGFRFNTSKIKRPINMALFEAMTFLLSHDIPDDDGTKTLINNLKFKFDISRKFNGNVDSSTSVSYRFDSMIDILKKYNYDKEYID